MKIYAYEALNFFRSLSISKNSLQTPSSEDIFAGNFTWSNSIILIENL